MREKERRERREKEGESKRETVSQFCQCLGTKRGKNERLSENLTFQLSE